MSEGIRILREIWLIIAEVAPYLLLGFGLAGLISLFLKRSLVERWLGKPGLGSIFKATLVGVPMPLCSCGVIPTAAAIRQQGASKGATVSFLASTPQMGIDGIAATWGLLGPFLAIVRTVVAALSGIVAGLLVQAVSRDEASSNSVSIEDSEDGSRTLQQALHYGFIKLPKDLAGSLTLGLLLAGLLGALLPGDFFTKLGLEGIAAYAVISAIGIPLYVCSTGAIPFAFMLLQAGLSPGAVLVFLITAPSTSFATLTTMRSYLDTRSIVAYLFAITLTAWTAGGIVDAGFGRDLIVGHIHAHEMEPGWFSQGAAVVLIVLLGYAFYSRWRSKPCCGTSCCGKAENESCCS